MPTIKERITITPDSEKDVKQIKPMTNAQRFKRFQRWEKMIAAKTADARRQAWLKEIEEVA